MLPTALQDREQQKFEEVDGQVTVRTKSKAQTIGLSLGGRHTAVTINDTTWTALPAFPLEIGGVSRNAICIQNFSGQRVKLNYDNSVPGFVGILVPHGSDKSYDIRGSVILYAKCETGSVTIDIEEIA